MRLFCWITMQYELWIFTLLFYVVTAKIVVTPKEKQNTTITKQTSESRTPLGRLCMTVEHFRVLPQNDTSGYLECSTLAEEERKEYGIEGKYLGLWTKRSCPKDHSFDAAKQRCIEKKKLHRQQAACLASPTVGCQYVCAAPIIEDPQIGMPCGWQQSRLYNDPSNNSGFLQCITTSATDPCGEWSRIDCPPTTTFELSIQICAPLFIQQKPTSELVSVCTAANEIAVCRCGEISRSCPGISVCRSGVCCAAVDPILVAPTSALLPAAQSPICSGSGAYPVSTCSIPCPPQYTCQPSVGCCPVILVPASSAAITTTTSPKMILVQLSSCPGTNTQPVASCGSCPPSYQCVPYLGACCPTPIQTTAAPTTAAPQPVILLCPKTSTPPIGNCNPCPPSYQCVPFLGACCPSPAPAPTTTQAPQPSSQIVILCPSTNTKPVASCGNCPSNYACNLVVGGCCPTPAPVHTTTMAPSPAPKYMILCPGTNSPPQGNCNPCPPPMVCTPVGCCAPSVPAPTSAPAICPGTSVQPIANCGNCPSNYICVPLYGACCPTPAPTTTAAPTTAPQSTYLLVCQSGTPATQSCTTTPSCPTGNVCYQENHLSCFNSGSCCPCQCPPQSVPVSFCPTVQMSPPAAAVPSCVCINGCCCQEQPQLPTCSNGQIAIVACTGSAQCGSGQECSNGGCCPILYCPSGKQAVGHCAVTPSCGSGAICLDGLCCQLPICANSQPATSFCTTNSNCNSGYECQNGACCSLPPIPIPLCPSGVISLAPCPPSCRSQCVSGSCCALPTCPTSDLRYLVVESICLLLGNQMAISFCAPQIQCPVGTECNTAISGAQALQRCGSAVGCLPGTSCVNGLCCASLPIPSIPLVCPSGGNAIQECVRGTECPEGYGCTPEGGCCQLVNVVDLICPTNSIPVCQCSPTNLCPSGSSCFPSSVTPTCCASTPTVYMAVPGIPCEASQQCAGYSNGASCLQNMCVCLQGSYSNGPSCVVQPPVVIQMARSGCDQFGSPCRYVLSSARRRPIFSPSGNNTEKPLWYNIAGERRCPRSVQDVDPDNTCLPNEKCIDTYCKLRLWPGEYGCLTDIECSSRCPNTYCEHRSDKNIPQCQCRNGLLLYGRCFDICPKGFHESGAYCHHDDEDAFWANSIAQQEVQKLLNNGTC
ncbi:hypothetical protein M3Y95_00701700 [Aphelenchoides besseyi]|nr:hypothetical protein M3Y95_00701700 [Aphelenchoides besseyi]